MNWQPIEVMIPHVDPGVFKRIDPVAMNWQPIETAPKDGRHILAWDSTYGPVVVRWKDYFGDAAWRNFEFRVLHKIIRWMPLPEPPQE